MKIHFTKQLAFTGNQRSSMLRLAPLYGPCFLASFPSLTFLLLKIAVVWVVAIFILTAVRTSNPTHFYFFQAAVLVIGAGPSRQFYWKTLMF
jgi:hypothetical protein